MRAQTSKLYRTFVKGLITEASPLTFPEDTTLDEDNCLLFSKGNRTRRLGADYEEDFVRSPFQVPSMATTPLTQYEWTAVNDQADTAFLCVQVSGTVYFYDMYSTPISGGLKGFSIDLTAYAAPGATSIEASPVQMTSGKGFLFIAGTKIQPLVVEYDALNDTITVETVTIFVRDFDGVDDDLAVDEEPSTLSDEHEYNLRNQGWTTQTTNTTKNVTLFGKHRVSQVSATTQDTITTYFTEHSVYPGNHKQWFLGRMAIDSAPYVVGDFNPELLNKAHVGNSRAPRGHFVIDAFNKDRTAVSGVTGLAPEVLTYRPASCAFFSGRAWWFAKNGVYFSQVMTNKAKAGQCYQEADPTAEDISELIETDGGYIPIPAADEILRGIEIGNGIIVFARNGVWLVSGTDRGFSAVEYQVTKISNIGTDSPLSIVAAGDAIFWWSKIGIQRITQASGQYGPIPGAYSSVNISQETIDTLFKGVSATSREFVKGVFDPATNTVYWLYRSEDLGINYGYNKMLNLDLQLGAFHPWSLETDGYPFICGAFIAPTLTIFDNVRSSFLQFICAEDQGAAYRFTIGKFYNEEYVDWESFDGTGVVYNSFVESGYELLEDAARKKQALYVVVFFRQTEENFVADGEDYTVDKPSSCYMTVKWDWVTSGNTGKYSQKRQVYKHRRVPFVDPDNLAFNTGTKVVSSKNKVRGTGRAVQFRFECNERGKNFDILGWQVPYQGNTAV